MSPAMYQQQPTAFDYGSGMLMPLSSPLWFAYTGNLVELRGSREIALGTPPGQSETKEKSCPECGRYVRLGA